MGLDAVVPCNCFKLGLTKEPPFPREWLLLDENGEVSLLPEFDTETNWMSFYEWTLDACEHSEMGFASAYISNWSGYRLFQEAMERGGLHRFKVLAEELPTTNSGYTTARNAAKALVELEEFRKLPTLGENSALVDTKTGYVIFKHIAAYEGVFILCGRSGIDVGVSEFEFFIRDRDQHADLFRATRVRQALLDPVDEWKVYDGRVEFTDLDTEATFTTSVAVTGREIAWPDGRMQNDQGQIKREHPLEFRVDRREVLPSQFDYIVEALVKVFRASIATGNPVRWC